MLFIGLMSGTSMDAVDAALVDIKDNRLTVIDYKQYPISKEIQSAIRSVNGDISISQITELDVILGELFAQCVLELTNANNLETQMITAIGSHGQTVLHLPDSNYPRTLQIGDPAIISVRTGIATIADFRRSDIAAGGQGAPLAPAFHAWQFRSNEVNRVILNLGGMANITVLHWESDKEIVGFDTGPGNCLLDNWTQQHINMDFDVDGKWAAQGTCDQALLDLFMSDPYFNTAPPKSTGKDYFNVSWLAQKIEGLDIKIADVDVQRTLLELSVVSISNAIRDYAQGVREVLVCGGGIHNSFLLERLRSMRPDIDICSTEKYGIHPDAVEAVAFAWLAKARLENTAGNIPSVTGTEKPVVLGAIYQA